jgi:hypothetical protein
MYAIMVKLIDGDWIYVVEDNENCWDLRPVLYKTFEQADQSRIRVAPQRQRN